MSFVVSARKYRPAQFRDVVGQKTITTTLKNALKNDKLAQSFLFCGPRGVGKTTCARILAKVINCQTPTADYEACNTCPACVAFNHSASFNIFELDAASNNSVEDIRNLIEQVRFAPQVGKYKIYIIDEVHMLSQAAFNAFLKTLEEPPSYAIFILATTEKHKILPTILSRCQIFDFQRIKVSDIVEHLGYICQDQGIEADEDALHVIAQKADGGLRDALSIFDRIASYASGRIQYGNVIEALNILDYDFYFKATDYLLSQNTAALLLLYDEVVRRGFEGDNFISGLCEHFRNLLVCKDPTTVSLLDVTQNLRDRYWQQAQLAPASFLLSALNIAAHAEMNYKNSRQKHLQIELALLKMACINQVVDLAKLGNNAIDEKKNNNSQVIVNDTPPVQYGEKKTPITTYNNNAKPVNLLDKMKNMAKDNALSPSHNVDTPQPSAYRSTNQASEQLNTDSLAIYWREFANTLSSQRVRATWEAANPVLQGQKIVLELSTLQEGTIRNETLDFIRFLAIQKQLPNYEIVRNIVQNKPIVSENQNARPIAYLPEDQFSVMLTENPALQLLKDTFQMDIHQ
ncbi:MAG: DNA polymerase III subunit gamma/tau [Chitinophagales bacterium]|nr:DNA polymerase III subunit gamma/tau [Chitinophagales bacterium]HNI43227.1 DNA polymerase III subunit gamma/tau [Chitinophagales bacterium]